MDSIIYEPHTYEDPSFPIIFHLDYMDNNTYFFTHWHENIEILLIIKGCITVLSDSNSITANESEIVVINANNIHHVQSLDQSEYYCLIIDKKLCEELGLFTEEIIFQRLINDKKARKIFNQIKNELLQKKALYKSAVKSEIGNLLIHLYRNYTLSESPLSNKLETIKIEMIKKSIKFIQDNYTEDISTTDIAKEIRLNKSYFCRIFKETTGYTVVFYINLLRCTKAKKLLQTGTYLVSEVAYICGFSNLSYFTKTYKMHIGCLPSSNKITYDL